VINFIEPITYVSARERSLRMKPSVESFFTFMSGDVSQIYSFTENFSILDHSLG
jgi:hypothetical protein